VKKTFVCGMCLVECDVVCCSGIECDLNINNSVGIRNTHLLNAYSCCKPRHILAFTAHLIATVLVVKSSPGLYATRWFPSLRPSQLTGYESTCGLLLLPSTPTIAVLSLLLLLLPTMKAGTHFSLDAARITKLDIQMFHDESWKPFYFGIKRSEVKVTGHKNSAGMGLCTLVSAGFF